MRNILYAVPIVLLLSVSAAGDEQEILAKVTAAQQAAKSAITSGRGVGKYVRSERLPRSGNWDVKDDADVDVSFLDRMYRIQLRYRKEYFKRSKRTIIFDGSALVVTRFSPTLTPVGGETEIFDASSRPLGLVRPVEAKFPWDISMLPLAMMIDVQALRNAIGDAALTIVDKGNGAHVISYAATNAPSVRAEFEVVANQGYNIVRATTLNGSVPYSTYAASWAQSENGLWYVKTLTKELFQADGGSKWQFEYDSFQANVPVSRDEFTLGSLEMPAGSRILDQRPKAPRDSRFHYVPLKPEQVEETLDKMVSEVDTLSTERPSSLPPVPDRRLVRIVVLAVNALLLLAVIAYLFYRYRAGGAATRSTPRRS